MANDINNIKDNGALIAKLAGGYISDHCQFIKSIDKADASDFEGKNGYSAGQTINVSIPARFTMGSGAAITAEDIEEGSVALTVNNQNHVAFEVTSAEIATEFALKSWAERVLKPAMITLSNGIEAAALEQASDATANAVGTAGSSVFDTDLILSAGEKLDISGCADYDNRFVLLNPAASRSAVNARKGLFQSSEDIAKQYRSGAMGMADGFTFLRNNLLPTHTNGNDDVFEVRTTVSTEGQATLVVEGLTTTTGTVKKGTVFTIATVYAVHPVTKATLSHLQQFVVTADATADGSGYATLSIDKPFYSSASGALQNISAFPADGDAITIVGSANGVYAQNLAYHKSAFRFCSVPLVKPQGVDLVGQETVDGITVRIVRDYDVTNDKLIMRADVLWGMANVRPEWASRLYS